MIKLYTCEICEKKGKRHYVKGRIPKHFFCSIKCHDDWQRENSDLGEINKTLKRRRAVSLGLKRRKKRLGENYHSQVTKRLIGKATRERWGKYKDKITLILKQNAINLRIRADYPYDTKWRKLRREIVKQFKFCPLCFSTSINIHHIIPYRVSGDSSRRNLVPACNRHHRILEYWSWKMFEIVEDWEVVRCLIKDIIFENRIKQELILEKIYGN